MMDNEDSPRQAQARTRRLVDEYIAHLEKISRVFTDHARELGLGVRLDATGVIQATRNGMGLPRVIRFQERADDSGVLHDSQLMTALNCVAELLKRPKKNGLVLGAMQSGKTTTSLALQFAGPIIYLLTGERFYPIYLITSHTSQEDQTKIEISRFLELYGELKIVLDERRPRAPSDAPARARPSSVDLCFAFSPTISTYREHVLKHALSDTMIGPRIEDAIHRRAQGDSIGKVAKLCHQATLRGFEPLLIIDEPQYGASDRLVNVGDSQERRPCVLLQIFQRIEEALGEGATAPVFIGLSATPYELHDIDAIWKVNQYLTSAYSGFNFFGGKVIDGDVEVTPPKTKSFGEFAGEIEVPFLERVSLTAYDADPAVFARFATKTGYKGEQGSYRRKVERTLREAILHMARKGSTPVGICMRLFNDNARSRRLIEALRLPSDQIEVVEYYGAEHRGQSVKRAIGQRKRPHLPFLIAVTNRARMGDAFPREVEWFLEFSKKAANLNALLQGLLGRACGYGKRSTVVLSEENAQLVEDYKRERGGYIYRTSRHSKIVQRHRRGAPTSLLRLRRDMDDPVVNQFFSRVDREVVAPHIIQGSAKVSAKRARGGRLFRTGPLLRIASELSLFDYLEQPDVRARLFQTYPTFRIARVDDQVTHARSAERKLGYSHDGRGNCRFTFREWIAGEHHTGLRSRGYGARDASDPANAGDTLEPQVNVRKIDPLTGECIDDKEINGKPTDPYKRRPGHWRAEMITLPLTEPVRELRAGTVAYPVEHCKFAESMSEEERTEAGHGHGPPARGRRG